MPFKIAVGKRKEFEKIMDAPNDEAGEHGNQQQDDDRRRVLESSLSSVDELQDFETFDPNDLVYREYEPILLTDSSHYERFDRLGQHTWKTGRPGQKQSFINSFFCTLQTTFVSGCIIGMILTIFVLLDVNLADLCYSHKNAPKDVPNYIHRIQIVSDTAASIITQFWHLITIIFVFGLSLIRESQIISWNILAGLLAGIYKLIYGLFMEKVVYWRSFPSYAIFIFVATYNSLKISNALKEAALGHSPYLIIKLVTQFVIGLPVFYIFTTWINPSYKSMNDVEKVAFASFVPLIIAIPKMILRKGVECMGKVNHPGTTVYLLMAFYTCASLLLRALQVQVYTIEAYVILSVIYGALSTIERAILPYADFLQHKFFKGKKRSLTEFMTPRHNRLMSDLTLTSMITEPSMIFVSCTAMAMLQYFYGHDKAGDTYDLQFVCTVASKRIATAMSVEIIFNVISLKVESYYFNMPVMKVWKLKKVQFLFTIICNSIIAFMCFSHVIYDALSTEDFFDGMLICSPPFSRPMIKVNHTI